MRINLKGVVTEKLYEAILTSWLWLDPTLRPDVLPNLSLEGDQLLLTTPELQPTSQPPVPPAQCDLHPIHRKLDQILDELQHRR